MTRSRDLANLADGTEFTAADHTKLDGIATSANNYVHPNHSGEVTSTADGATVIVDDIVDEANLKVSNTPTNGYFLSAQSGNTGGMTWAEVAQPSASDTLNTIKTVDGTGSGLDADLLDGQEGAYYAPIGSPTLTGLQLHLLLLQGLTQLKYLQQLMLTLLFQHSLIAHLQL